MRSAAALLSMLFLTASGGMAEPPAASSEAHLWLEATPLAGSDAPVVLSVRSGVPVALGNAASGLFLVCLGGDGVAVACEQRYLEAGVRFVPRPQRGARVTGTVMIGSRPAPGSRIAVVPKSLRSARFVKLPLSREPEGEGLVREVTADARGRFSTPELAPGEYLLEIVPPGGRFFHSDPLTIPPRSALLPKGPLRPGSEAILDVGEIAFDEGVKMEVFVSGPNAEILPGAKVGAHQGEKAEESQFFEAAADAGGKAVLAGLDPAKTLAITCHADGYLDVQSSFATPPSAFTCTLQPLALLEGTVRDAEDRPVAGAAVLLETANRHVATGKDGRFTLTGIQPGTHRLVVSALGFKVERLALEVEAGDRKVLPPIGLLPGREITGLVRDARMKEPISGALVSAPELADGAGATSNDEGRFTLAFWDEEAEAPCQGCDVVISGEGKSHRLVTGAEGEALSEPLAPGRYSAAPSIVKSLGSVVFRQGGGDTRWVEVLPGVTSSVEFGDRSPSLRVRFRPPVPEGWLLSVETASVNRVADRQADGTFKVRRPTGDLGLHLGRALTTVSQGRLQADDGATALDLILPQTDLRGQLLRGEEPAGGRRVQAVLMADPTVQGNTLSGEDGGFSIPFLPAGLYTVFVDGTALRAVHLAEGEGDLGRIELAKTARQTD
jgi:carboxypeptidase family protein